MEVAHTLHIRQNFNMAVNMSDASTDVSTCYSTNDCLSSLKTLQIDDSNGEKGESFTNILIKKLSTMHPNSETNIIAEDNSCEPEKSEESQNVYDVSISEQSQDIFAFDEGILTGTINQKNNKHVSHTDEVNYIIDHSQTPNMVPQTLHKNQEMMTENCLQTMPQTDAANSSNADLLKYVCRLEARMEKLFDIIAGDMRELRSIIDLSFEIRSSRTLNENLSLKEEISHLNEKIKNQSCLISDLDTKLKELNNERNSLLTVIRILQVENQNFPHYQRQQQVANLHANINHPPQSQQSQHVAPSAHINNLHQSLPTQTDQGS
ncbi:Hypothetical predicted protein [Paramuricea clavata]|uniref:Uncharacterized protein n=2 Tax=Paramuricea clavata TaxID=317549 RepID=A0A6S7J983_PARCT|nr:Hypothetical predicted protein [Paramuricea clavata]